MKNRMLASALAALFALPIAAHAASTRTHVSNSGSDANAAFSCDAAHPCRTFATALAVTTPGGEILAIDSSGFGKVVIDRSVSIVAAPGVYAGIGVGAGGNATGVEIATPGVNVVLRGLTITGQGGNYGVRMTNGTKLAVENCVISNFLSPGQFGVLVSTAAGVYIADTLFRDNYNGIYLSSGATGTAVRIQLDGGNAGITAWSSAPGTTALSISDSVVSGATEAVSSRASSAGATTRVTLGNSVVTQNNSGIIQSTSGGGVAIFESLGNNTVRQNTTNTSGTITTVAPI